MEAFYGTEEGEYVIQGLSEFEKSKDHGSTSQTAPQMHYKMCGNVKIRKPYNVTKQRERWIEAKYQKN